MVPLRLNRDGSRGSNDKPYGAAPRGRHKLQQALSRWLCGLGVRSRVRCSFSYLLYDSVCAFQTVSDEYPGYCCRFDRDGPFVNRVGRGRDHRILRQSRDLTVLLDRGDTGCGWVHQNRHGRSERAFGCVGRGQVLVSKCRRDRLGPETG